MACNQEIVVNFCERIEGYIGKENISYDLSTMSDVTICGHTFRVITKDNITSSNVLHTVETIKDQCGGEKKTLLVTNYITPKLVAIFRSEGISIADRYGNCSIVDGNLYIFNSGCKRDKADKENRKGSLNSKSLYLIYYLLTDEKLVKGNYRSIQKTTGISLATISRTMDYLQNKGFIVVYGKEKCLMNKRELIELWQQGYNDIVKPKLLAFRYEFKEGVLQKDWKQIDLPEGMQWGGDCAANLMDGYLIPGLYEVYTGVLGTKLMTTGKVKLSQTGPIKVYKKWWNDSETPTGKTVPPLIVYADLVGTGDSRCKEAAERILDKI